MSSIAQIALTRARHSQIQLDRKPLAARHIAAQTLLFSEGDPAGYIYKVMSGVLRQTRVSVSGHRQVLSFSFPGDMVGIPACGIYGSDCTALTEASVVAMRCDGEGGVHGQGLLRAAMQEIASLQDHLLVLGRKSAAEKVASFLALLVEKAGARDCNGIRLELPMGRSDIGDYLGLSTETVSRTISAFRKMGILELDSAHRLVVLDEIRLLAEAEGT